MKTADVLVVGGGIAGVAAAVAATSAGARAVLVRRGPGVSALVGGGWLDAPPARFADLLRAAGLPLRDCIGALAHPDGTLLHCEVAPASHVHAVLGAGGDRALVCGIAGLPGFRAAALASLWTAAAGSSAGPHAAVTLTLDATPAAGWSPVSLAAELQREPHRLAAPLAHAVREHAAARVILPAVLGIEAHADVLARVADVVGVPVGEALGVAPSLPGWRLDLALQTVLAQAGVQLITGSATAAGGSVMVATAAGAAVTVRAGAVVLAAGKFAGGGITADRGLHDSVRNVSAGIDRVGRRFDDASDALTLTDVVRVAAQPLLTAGVAPDSDASLFVAGSMRAGVETAALGLGAAAHDGWNAGLAAAAAAGGAAFEGE